MAPPPALLPTALALLLALPSPSTTLTVPITECTIANASQVTSSPAGIATVGFNASLPTWLPASLPSTVMAGLVQNNVYPDPFFGRNLEQIPHMHITTPTWWFRAEFSVPINGSSGPAYPRLRFQGINYRADIWLDGELLANSTEVVGAFRYFSFDLDPARFGPGSRHALALMVTRPRDQQGEDVPWETDLAITFVDWAPPPPDANTGVWRNTLLDLTGPVTLDSPLVLTALESDGAASVDILFRIQAHSYSSLPSLSPLVVSVSLQDVGTVEQNVSLPAPGASAEVWFRASDFPLLARIPSPRLWWPWQMGEPSLSQLNASVTLPNGQISHSTSSSVGLRNVTSSLDANGHRLFAVNNRPILVRGAGWAPDLFLRVNSTRQAQELGYVRDLGLNTIRLEGKMEDDNFFALADQMGLMVMAGWCCCDAWGNWNFWTNDSRAIAAASQRDQARRLRAHPSIIGWLYGSDNAPPQEDEAMFMQVLAEEHWPVPFFSAASNQTTPLTGNTGFKMTGPYSWTTPNYWLTNKDAGGAFGFFTEGGPGQAPMVFESVNRTLPAEDLWPMNDAWAWHCGAPFGQGGFYNLLPFTEPLNKRYGHGSSAQDYLMKAQVMAYEALRAFFEAYTRNKYTASTGVIFWMLNNAWPEMIWHLYDYYLSPGGAYFGAKKALAPLTVMYSYDDSSVWVLISQYEDSEALAVNASLISLDGTVKWNAQHGVGVARADSSLAVPGLFIPKWNQVADESSAGAFESTAYFLRLDLLCEGGVVARNDYWLSTAQEDPGTGGPLDRLANFTALLTLPRVDLVLSETTLNSTSTMVTVQNPTSHVAFFIRLRLVVSATMVDLLPVLWEDNCFTLMPGESRSVLATHASVPPQSLTVLEETYNNVSGGQ